MHSHLIVGAIYLGLLLLATTLLLMFRGRLVLNCNAALDRMYKHQLHGLGELVESSIYDDRTWEETNGLVGLWCRWWNAAYLVRLCQLRSLSDKHVTALELRYVAQRASLLTSATLRAAMFAPVRRLVSRSASAAAHRALKIYADISDRTCTFYSAEDAPLCAQRLASIL